MSKKCWIALAGLVTGSNASFAAPPDPLLDHMTGHWVLTGTIAGQQTTHDVDAEWILQNRYVRLHEVSRETDASGKPRYEAEVLIGYDAPKQRYACFWFDITGVAAPGSGAVTERVGDTLPFVFKTEGDHATFAYQAASDTWTWTIDGEQGGKLVPFARVTLKQR